MNPTSDPTQMADSLQNKLETLLLAPVSTKGERGPTAQPCLSEQGTAWLAWEMARQSIDAQGLATLLDCSESNTKNIVCGARPPSPSQLATITTIVSPDPAPTAPTQSPDKTESRQEESLKVVVHWDELTLTAKGGASLAATEDLASKLPRAFDRAVTVQVLHGDHTPTRLLLVPSRMMRVQPRPRHMNFKKITEIWLADYPIHLATLGVGRNRRHCDAHKSSRGPHKHPTKCPAAATGNTSRCPASHFTFTWPPSTRCGRCGLPGEKMYRCHACTSLNACPACDAATLAAPALRMTVHGKAFACGVTEAVIGAIVAPLVPSGCVSLDGGHIAANINQTMSAAVVFQKVIASRSRPKQLRRNPNPHAHAGFTFGCGTQQIAVYEKFPEVAECVEQGELPVLYPGIIAWHAATRAEARLRQLGVNIAPGKDPLATIPRFWNDFAVADIRQARNILESRLVEYASKWGWQPTPPSVKRLREILEERRKKKKPKRPKADIRKMIFGGPANNLASSDRILLTLLQNGMKHGTAEKHARILHEATRNALEACASRTEADIGTAINSALPALSLSLKRVLGTPLSIQWPMRSLTLLTATRAIPGVLAVA